MKKSVKKLVEQADEMKKVNPLDLSSDQDLTIALMNLVAIEHCAPGSRVAELTAEIRKKLMQPMMERIKSDDKVCVQAEDYLFRSVEQIEMAENAQQKGDFDAGYRFYDAAYDAYVLYLATLYGLDA